MTLDDTQTRREHIPDQEAEGIDSEPHAEVRRQGSFADSDLPDESVEVNTALKGSFGEVDRTPGTEGDDPTGGMVDTAAVGGMQGSFGDVDETGGPVDTSERGSYGELDAPVNRERVEEVRVEQVRVDDEPEATNRNG